MLYCLDFQNSLHLLALAPNVSLDGSILQQTASEELIKSWSKNPPTFWQKVGKDNKYLLGVVDDNGNEVIFDIERYGGMGPVWL